jgi:hypothetical protein
VIDPWANSNNLNIAIDKFTKWSEVELVRTIPARSAVVFIKRLT